MRVSLNKRSSIIIVFLMILIYQSTFAGDFQTLLQKKGEYLLLREKYTTGTEVILYKRKATDAYKKLIVYKFNSNNLVYDLFIVEKTDGQHSVFMDIVDVLSFERILLNVGIDDLFNVKIVNGFQQNLDRGLIESSYRLIYDNLIIYVFPTSESIVFYDTLNMRSIGLLPRPELIKSLRIVPANDFSYCLSYRIKGENNSILMQIRKLIYLEIKGNFMNFAKNIDVSVPTTLDMTKIDFNSNQIFGFLKQDYVVYDMLGKKFLKVHLNPDSAIGHIDKDMFYSLNVDKEFRVISISDNFKIEEVFSTILNERLLISTNISEAVIYDKSLMSFFVIEYVNNHSYMINLLCDQSSELFPIKKR